MQSILEVFAPVPMRWRFGEPRDERVLSEQALMELEKLSGKVNYTQYNGKSFPVEICVFDEPEKYTYFSDNWAPPSLPIPYCFIRLSSRAEYSDDELHEWMFVGTEYEVSKNDANICASESSARDLQTTLIDLSLASNIANPGGLNFDKCHIFSNNRAVGGGKSVCHTFYDSWLEAKKLGWPSLKQIPLSQVWDWLQNIEGFKTRIGTTNIGRALASLSYLMRPGDGWGNNLDLVWSLLGLEAIYCKGNVGLKSQLLEKTTVLLGERKENKKLFGWMYDFRSRLVHGDVDIVYFHNEYDATQAHERFSEDLFKCETIATALLLSTIQEMCLQNTFKLDFKYKMTD